MPEVPLWAAIGASIGSTLAVVATGVLAWVKWGTGDRPIATATADQIGAEAALRRAETEHITVSTLKDTIEEIRALSDTRKADVDELRAQLRQQRDEHNQAFAALRVDHAREIQTLRDQHAAEIQRLRAEMAAQVADMRRRLDQTPAVPPPAIGPHGTILPGQEI